MFSFQDADDDEKEDYDIDIGLGEEASGSGGSGAQRLEEEYVFEVLSTEKIVQNMVDIIKEVNSVMQVIFAHQHEVVEKFIYQDFKFQIPATTVRILLNHFKWDKEKLLDKFYTGDDHDSLFAEAKVVSPYKDSSPSQASGPGTSSSSSTKAGGSAASAPIECEICCMKAMKSVRNVSLILRYLVLQDAS